MPVKHGCTSKTWMAGVALVILQTGGPAMAARPSYMLGPDDQVVVQALHAPDIKEQPQRIDSSGYLTLPLAGRVRAAGRTVEELQKELVVRLRPFIRKPEVTVSVSEYRSQPVSVAGPVMTPGVYQLQGHKTLMEVLALAGGAKPEAADTVRITRRVQCAPFQLESVRRDAAGQVEVGEVSLQGLLEVKNPGQNPEICPQDVITLARAPLVYVMGEVRKPGGFPLRDREQASVLEAISMSEGLVRTASPAKARILRWQPNGAKRTEIAVNLNTILSGKTADVALQANDILFVPDSVPKSALLRGAEAAVQMGTGVVIWRR